MKELRLELYWNDIPIGKENAVTYDQLKILWSCSVRNVRMILHELSLYDDGSSFALIRTSKGKGFYKTDDVSQLKEYRQECLDRGRNTLATIKKINRIIKNNTEEQYSFGNNLRLYRTKLGLSLAAVVEILQELDSAIDCPMLSKMENNACLPTFRQLARLSEIYRCEPQDLVNIDLFM